jgi:uncharacterized protein (TIGR02145 family)
MEQRTKNNYSLRIIKNILFIITVFLFYTYFLSCSKDSPQLMKVQHDSISHVFITSAILHSQVIDIGEGIEQHGHCLSMDENPTLENCEVHSVLGKVLSEGSFTDTITKLKSNTRYYARAYLKRAQNIVYSKQLSFNTLSPSLPTVLTLQIVDIMEQSVKAIGIITNTGLTETGILDHGFCWSATSLSPTLLDESKSLGKLAAADTFVCLLEGLKPNSLYNIRAYATNDASVSYGMVMQFTTKNDKLPVITTSTISNISNNKATGGGNVSSQGGSPVTSRGICWSTSQNPSVSDSHTNDGSGLGSFESAITGLTANSTYFVRAYAINNYGTSYGNEVAFNTGCDLPMLTTSTPNSISISGAISGGNIAADGGCEITSRGVCWSTSSEPTLMNNSATSGTGTGSYTITITGLSANTTYYIRSFAINAKGTAYGNQFSFTTGCNLPVITTVSASSVETATAVSGGNITHDGGCEITARGVCWSTSINPTLNENHTTDGEGTGYFVSSLSGLSPNTSYYIRAYATNSKGTSYGIQVSFNTGCNVPIINTVAPSSITYTSAITGGDITITGGCNVSSRGVCWNTMANPTIGNFKTYDGTDTGAFISNISALDPNTTYYVRAYVISNDGIFYGNEQVFSTPAYTVPTLTTAAVSLIGSYSAQSGGDISGNGGTSIIARGVCWNTIANPTIENHLTTDGTGTGSYISILEGLVANTTYYVRAYATNSIGTAYGNEVTFNTKFEGETVTDIEGNVYNTIAIGTQTWMAENLKTTRYSDNTQIPLVTDKDIWAGLITHGFCWYSNNETSYKSIYGALYNWYAVSTGKLCPTGWHVPTLSDWNALKTYTGDPTFGGAKLKQVGFSHWKSPNVGATNETGFTALPGGYRDHYGNFYNITTSSRFWSSTLVSGTASYYTEMQHDNAEFFIGYSYPDQRHGLSVRCLKN